MHAAAVCSCTSVIDASCAGTAATGSASPFNTPKHKRVSVRMWGGVHPRVQRPRSNVHSWPSAICHAATVNVARHSAVPRYNHRTKFRRNPALPPSCRVALVRARGLREVTRWLVRPWQSAGPCRSSSASVFINTKIPVTERALRSSSLGIPGFEGSVHRPELYVLENAPCRKLDLLASSGEGRETPTLLGLLEGAMINPVQ
jgi:hypothetical protein